MYYEGAEPDEEKVRSPIEEVELKRTKRTNRGGGTGR